MDLAIIDDIDIASPTEKTPPEAGLAKGGAKEKPDNVGFYSSCATYSLTLTTGTSFVFKIS